MTTVLAAAGGAEIALAAFVLAVLFGFIGAACGRSGGNDRGGAGFFLGFVLGPIGCAVAFFLPPVRQGPSSRASLMGTTASMLDEIEALRRVADDQG